MAKYKVLRDCHGFRGGYWIKGQIVEINPSENPPEHFQLIGNGKEVEPETPELVPEPATFSGINKANEAAAAAPKTGMGHTPDKASKSSKKK